MSEAAVPAQQITPGLRPADPHLRYWLAQVNLRLRREVAWSWWQRTGQMPHLEDGALPPVSDAALENLDLVRYHDLKTRFFRDDTAAAYLTQQLDNLKVPDTPPEQGDWAWVRDTVALQPAEEFVMALVMTYRLDAGLGPIFANCMNDLTRPYPSLALAQRLWDDPNAVLPCMNPEHTLYRHGLLRAGDANGSHDWLGAISMPAAVFASLSAAGETAEPRKYVREERKLPAEAAALIGRLREAPAGLRLVPLQGRTGEDFAAWATALAGAAGRRLWQLPPYAVTWGREIRAHLTAAWLRGADLLLPDGWWDGGDRAERRTTLEEMFALPVQVYVPCTDSSAFTVLSPAHTAPAFIVPAMDFQARRALWQKALNGKAKGAATDADECARRFRFPELRLRRMAADAARGKLAGKALLDTCRAEARAELGHLAEQLTPRFALDELILPPAQARQFADVMRAMQSLTRVHYQWGTARAWNESGLAVLFCGPPGTGKTMGAEVIANALDMDLYRIDLSQVINKYIGETEKNLKRIFDAAEDSDSVLFFYEAVSLFGKRTEVRDANDRFANVQTGYLLERMERFKGLAILATNRRKDLDEAFTRRLRYILEFPATAATERERIWRQVFPDSVDTGELDFAFLARQFTFSGGHIRSVSLNACLQAAARVPPARPPKGKRGKVDMRDVLGQIKRELEKMQRVDGPEQFGQYAELINEEWP